VISRTRQWVLRRTPFRIATGQYVMSVEAFAPCAQPRRQVPALMHGARPSCSTVVMALSDGHQCQPSLLKPRASVSPSLPSVTGGSGTDFGGYAGSPVRPDTPIMCAFTS
jgi:hypothetical protein